jgi:hypothetical protein
MAIDERRAAKAIRKIEDGLAELKHAIEPESKADQPTLRVDPRTLPKRAKSAYNPPSVEGLKEKPRR